MQHARDKCNHNIIVGERGWEISKTQGSPFFKRHKREGIGLSARGLCECTEHVDGLDSVRELVDGLLNWSLSPGADEINVTVSINL
jgi:hypothetical protein